MDTVVYITSLICATVAASTYFWSRSARSTDTRVLREVVSKLETQVVQGQTLVQRALYELTSLRAEMSADNHEDRRRFETIEESVGKHEMTLTRYAKDLREATDKVTAEVTKISLMQQPQRKGF